MSTGIVGGTTAGAIGWAAEGTGGVETPVGAGWATATGGATGEMSTARTPTVIATMVATVKMAVVALRRSRDQPALDSRETAARAGAGV